MTAVIVRPRNSGKTTELIQRAATIDAAGGVAYVVVADRERAHTLFQTAQNIGVNIRFPISWREFVTPGSRGFITDYLFDDVDDILRYLAHGRRVSAITLTSEESDLVKNPEGL